MSSQSSRTARPYSLSAFVVLDAFQQGVTAFELRKKLSDRGVRRSSVTKACTVLSALHGGTLSPEDVTSVGSAYNMLLAESKIRELDISLTTRQVRAIAKAVS